MSAPIPESLVVLWSQFGERVGQAVDAALQVEPAGAISDRWKEILARCTVAALGEEERFAAAQAHKQTKGAPLPEVEACLAALAGEARARLTGLADAGQAHKELMANTLAAAPAEVLAAYRQAACARPKGMFGHAMATAKQHQYDGIGKSTSYVLKCATCGGPRLRADLACSFCGGRVG